MTVISDNTDVTDVTDDALQRWGAHDQDNPFRLYDELRERAAVHEAALADGHRAWLVVRYDEARAALNDPRLSKDMRAALAASPEIVAEGLPGPALARHMLNVDPPDHTRLRRLVAAAFTPRRVEQLRPWVQRITDDLLDEIAGRGPDAVVDFVESFAFPLPFTVICQLLGVPEADRDRLGHELKVLLGPSPTREASDAVVGMLEAFVAAKQREPADDLISALIAARDGDDRLATDELLSTIFLLVVAGHETTTNLLGNSVVALLQRPDLVERLRSDPAQIPGAVEELVRYDSPAHHTTFRYATEPVELGGVTIPEGGQVVICLAAANRDPARFSAPDQLELGRDDARHLGFGHGIHHCLGVALARVEAEIALGSLLRRFPQLRVAVPREDLHWSNGDGVVLRGLGELPVIAGDSG